MVQLDRLKFILIQKQQDLLTLLKKKSIFTAVGAGHLDRRAERHRPDGDVRTAQPLDRGRISVRALGVLLDGEARGDGPDWMARDAGDPFRALTPR